MPKAVFLRDPSVANSRGDIRLVMEAFCSGDGPDMLLRAVLMPLIPDYCVLKLEPVTAISLREVLICGGI